VIACSVSSLFFRRHLHGTLCAHVCLPVWLLAQYGCLQVLFVEACSATHIVVGISITWLTKRIILYLCYFFFGCVWLGGEKNSMKNLPHVWSKQCKLFSMFGKNNCAALGDAHG